MGKPKNIVKKSKTKHDSTSERASISESEFNLTVSKLLIDLKAVSPFESRTLFPTCPLNLVQQMDFDLPAEYFKKPSKRMTKKLSDTLPVGGVSFQHKSGLKKINAGDSKKCLPILSQENSIRLPVGDLPLLTWKKKELRTRCTELKQNNGLLSRSLPVEINCDQSDQPVNQIVSEDISLPILDSISMEDEQNMKPSSVVKVPKVLKSQPVSLSKADGVVLHSYCIKGILIVVQVNKVQFWKLATTGESIIQDKWIHVGMLSREKIVNGNIIGVHAAHVTEKNDMGVLYAELWKSECVSDAIRSSILLKASCYYCNAEKNYIKHDIILLEIMTECIKDVKFCVLSDISLFVCMSSSTNPASYHGNVKKYSLNDQLAGVLDTNNFMFTICPLTYLCCVNESESVVLGRNGVLMFLWRHTTETDFNAFRLDDPDIDNRFAWLPLHWSTEKEGFLFMMFEERRNFELIALNIQTTSMKKVRQYKIPDVFERVVGVVVTDDTLVAAFKNGVVCWELESTIVLAESEITDERELYLGTEHAILIKSGYNLETVDLAGCSIGNITL